MAHFPQLDRLADYGAEWRRDARLARRPPKDHAKRAPIDRLINTDGRMQAGEGTDNAVQE